MKKWLKGIVFAFVFLAGILPCRTVFADDGWGTYGDNIKWHFYEKTGTLQIEGEGAMIDGNSADKMPWYSYRDQIKKVKIGKGVTQICDDAFKKYSNLTSVSIPKSVESIGRCTFYRTGLKKVVLPDGVKSVDWESFGFCENLESVEIPGSMKTVAGSSFTGCKNLSSIKIGDGVEVLEDTCFSGAAITSIDIPASVTKISSAFWGCYKLDHITIPSTVKEVGVKMCFACASLRYVIYKAPCSIPYGAFGACDNLVAVKIGEGVTSINYFSFLDDKNLKIMFVPSSVTSIDKGAFYSGTNDVTFYGYTDTEAYNYAGMNQFVKFVDVEAQGMDKWEKAWNQAIKKGAPDDGTKKTMKFTSLNIKKGATKITGKLSVSGATVKVKIGNAAYKKAAVTKKSFSIKSPKLKKGTVVRIRVTKDGYKTLSKLVKVK